MCFFSPTIFINKLENLPLVAVKLVPCANDGGITYVRTCLGCNPFGKRNVQIGTTTKSFFAPKKKQPVGLYSKFEAMFNGILLALSLATDDAESQVPPPDRQAVRFVAHNCGDARAKWALLANRLWLVRPRCSQCRYETKPLTPPVFS